MFCVIAGLQCSLKGHINDSQKTTCFSLYETPSIAKSKTFKKKLLNVDLLSAPSNPLNGTG